MALLLTAAAVVVTLTARLTSDLAAGPAGRTRQFGVLMPDAAPYQKVVAALQASGHPQELVGLTVTRATGTVTVLHAKRKSATSFPSTYLNPNALSLIARSIGVRSDNNITVVELRLEKVRATKHLRWRLRGEQAGRPWRAVIAPNGTELHLLPTNPANRTAPPSA